MPLAVLASGIVVYVVFLKHKSVVFLHFRDLGNLAIRPQVLNVVVGTWFALHDMYKDIAIIQHYPLCVVASIYE